MVSHFGHRVILYNLFYDTMKKVSTCRIYILLYYEKGSIAKTSYRDDVRLNIHKYGLFTVPFRKTRFIFLTCNTQSVFNMLYCLLIK